MEPGDHQEDELHEEPLPASLEAALLEAAADLPGLVMRTAGRRRDFLVGSRVVATFEGGVAEYRLDPAVAAAALRTPDTRPSQSAADRIAFEPGLLDRYAADRAVAWLRSAVRRAG
jgi:hypothetical protein